MRIAAIYDIHGNLPALEAVLDEIHAEQVDLIVVGGDVITGPMPLETLTLLQEVSLNIPIQCIRGNGESEVLRHLAGKPINALTARAEELAPWVANQLGPEQKQFLSSWSTTLQFEIDGWGEVLFCHATPHNNTDIFTRLTPEAKLLSIFDNVTASLVICGHTHMQFDRTISTVRVANAGSVGMPFGQTGAHWLMLDHDITFRHTDYNLNQAADRIRQTDYPQAEEFATDNILDVPSELAILKILAQLEANQSAKR